jgi:hypothetical protein
VIRSPALAFHLGALIKALLATICCRQRLGFNIRIAQLRLKSLDIR